MTHQNYQTNGASLEDCHTNFFALTDLCGIKWRKFVNNERPNASSDPLDDPILRSYSRCMQADILCVWRRKATKQDNTDPNALPFEINSSKVHPPLSLAAAKELWIFWYGEEPDLTNIVDSELIKIANNQALWNGTWERGLSYECRSLLFKALHNLMERFVLTKDIVRFGKWFVQPSSSNDGIFGKTSHHLSFSFTFFVHGDTVCASIDLREHPAVRPLNMKHLAEAAAAFSTAPHPSGIQDPHNIYYNHQNSPYSPLNDTPDAGTNFPALRSRANNNEISINNIVKPKPRKVILAPFGIAATLTGNSYKSTDPVAEKILDDWASFFPLCSKENSELPPVVEVISGGHKMYYPSMYVLVTDLDDIEKEESVASEKNDLDRVTSAELAANANHNTTGMLASAEAAATMSKTTSASLAMSAASSTILAKTMSGSTLINKSGTHPLSGQNGFILQKLQKQKQQHSFSNFVPTGGAKEICRKFGNQSHHPNKFHPYYGTFTNTFNCSTPNTHASPQAAAEMPERAWQDCITTRIRKTAMIGHYECKGENGANNNNGDSNNTINDHKNNKNNNENENIHNKNNNICNISNMTSSTLPQQTTATSLKQHQNVNYQRPTTPKFNANNRLNSVFTDSNGHLQQIWSFVDPTQKSFCICTKSLENVHTTSSYTSQGKDASNYSRSSIADFPVPLAELPGTPAVLQSTSIPSADQLFNKSPQVPSSFPNIQEPLTPIPTPTDQHDKKNSIASPFARTAPCVEQPKSAGKPHGNDVMGYGTLSQPGSVSSNDMIANASAEGGIVNQQHLSSQTSQQLEPKSLKISVKRFEISSTDGDIKLSNNMMVINDRLDSIGSTAGANNIESIAAATSNTLKEFFELCKPPKLKIKDNDSSTNDHCSKLDVLYDFSVQEAWTNHPIKRFKSNEIIKPYFNVHIKNLYEGHNHCKPTMPTPGSVCGSQLPSVDSSGIVTYPNDIKFNITSTSNKLATGAISDTAAGNVGLVGFSQRNTSDNEIDGNGFFSNCVIKGDTKNAIVGMTSPCKDSKSGTTGNFYTAEGLNPSMNDLEELFETSSNDGCPSLPLHTGPASNNPTNARGSTSALEDLKRCTNLNTTSKLSVSMSGAETADASLTSATNCNSSPCQMDIQMTDISVMTSAGAVENNLNLSGPVQKIRQDIKRELEITIDKIDENSLHVHKPAQQAKFVGSVKYAPLTNLPSQTLPPLQIPPNGVYKPSWVKTQRQLRQQRTVSGTSQLSGGNSSFQKLPQHRQQPESLSSGASRTSHSQQLRTPIDIMTSSMHNKVVPSSNADNNLLLNQLNGPQAALTNTHCGFTGGPPTMQQLLQRVGISPASSPASAAVSLPRGSPMMLSQRQMLIPPPPPYEMVAHSPATSTSSYLNKQYNSQEPPHTPQSVGMSTMVGGPHSALPGSLTGLSNCFGSTYSILNDLPEVNSLMVNILLYDTALNVFRDHNFDSSTVCVCNADTQKVGNIRGADSGIYVPLPGTTFNPAQVIPRNNFANGGGSGPSLMSSGNCRMMVSNGSGVVDSGHVGSNSSTSTTPITSNFQHINGYVGDDSFECTCGFSAVVNRRLAYRAGLFYEDEMEITGIAEDPARKRKQPLMTLITNLSAALRSSTVSTPATSSSSLTCVKSNTSNSICSPNTNSTDQLAHAIFDLLLEQCSIIQTSTNSIHRALQRHRRRVSKESQETRSILAIANVLEFVDANDVICLALEQARLAFETGRSRMDEFVAHHQISPLQSSPMSGLNANSEMVDIFSTKLSAHKWPYIPVGFSRSNKDIVRTMNFIQPMLQNAFHSKSRSAAGCKNATYTVSGPLTWRQFHRLAGRASGQCEPQPIPSVIVGHDKDWISVAPFAIQYWDKFLLEPYSYARDIVYLIVCPENDYVVSNTRTYFKELSSTYETCRLGKHTPMRGLNGMLTVGNSSASEVTTTPLDEWLGTLEDEDLAEKLKLYADVFHNSLAKYLNQLSADRSLLNPPASSSQSSHINSQNYRGASPNSNNIANMHSTADSTLMDVEKSSPPKPDSSSCTEQSMDSNIANNKNDTKADVKPSIVLGDPLGVADTFEEINPSAIVLYVVEPFTFGSDSPELERLACIVLLRCYSELLKVVPESVRSNLKIQIVSLESILELGCTRNRKRFSDEIKCLALNVFSQCRRPLVHTQSVKSLTGFGTAANMEAFLKSKDGKNRQAYKMYTPPYILNPVHEKTDKTDFSRSPGMRNLNEQKYSVMYCNYCLSEDQTWLLASVTDDRGELFEKTCINIDVPNRLRRRKTPARAVGLKKLMDFVMSVVSQTTQPWRLVIGRIGRIGHSELKSWSYLLSKPNLQKASKQLRDACKQCTLTYPPSILSACLVTLEPDSKLRVMPDQFTPDERFSQISMQNPLSTPQDVTCTHILVFPTSAVCHSFTRQFQNEPQVDLDNDFLNFEECEDENEGFTDADLMGDLLDWEPQLDHDLTNHGSPDRMEENRSWQSAGGNNFNQQQQQEIEEVGSINQQPLAVGYMVSTAPTGRMPSWFWSACPHLEDVCPVFLKTALHLHVPNIQTTDDILNATTNAHSSANDHPLDSTLTADVLRFVLEGYNSLSWLALDSNTHDRLSCLPINVQMLMDLYYLTAAIA